MKQKRKIIYFIFYWLLFSGTFFKFVYSHEILAIVPDILVFYLLFSKSDKKNKVKAIKPYVGRYVPNTIGAFLLITTLSSIINMSGLLSYLWGLRMFLRYLGLFYLVTGTFKMKDVEKVKNWLYKAYYINLAVIGIQFFLLNINGDAISGIFSSNGGIVAYIFITSFIFTGDYCQKRLKLSRYCILMGAMLFIAVVAEIKLLYFVVPLCFYAGYTVYKKFSMSHIVTIVVLYFSLIPLMTSIMSLYYDEAYVNQVFDSEYIENETSHAYGFAEGIGFNRNTCVAMCSDNILQDDLHKTIGYGLGSGSASTTFSTWIYKIHKRTTYHYFTASYVMVEGGWSGLILYLSIFVALLYRYWKVYKRTKDNIVKYWSGLGMLLSGVIYINLWYNAFPYTDGYLYYFMWALCFVGIKYRNQEIASKACSTQNLN